jgi:hypothetical protein
MQAEDRALVMGELAEAVRRVEVRLHMKLHPHWMASGGMGCWLQLFFASPCKRSVLGALLGMIREELPHEVGR